MEIDVRSEASVDAGVDAAAERLGGLEVVVDAAGISPVYRRVAQLSVADWDAVFETNARGAFLVARSAGRHLLAGEAGSLIFITSIHEQVGGERLSAYAASKGAVRQLARSLALEWAASGVRVNCIAPAYAETDLTAGLRANDHFRDELLRQTPTGRWVGLDEIAGAAVYLASDVAASVTGTTLTIDGGWTAR
jgi:NAD(P)-dependent dehydrogenase (short-subunit alcohol dehydrogenase family)